MADLKFDISKTNLNGVKLLHYKKFEELRGNIFTTYKTETFDINFNHDKFSTSNYNVLRGIHGDSKSTKLVTAVYGTILQVVVDLRENSSTYLQHLAIEIDRQSGVSVLIPPGCGNAYYVLSEQCVYHYKLSYDGDYIDATEQFTVNWNDSRLKINWPTENPILSERDA